jgi:hypothetical protein
MVKKIIIDDLTDHTYERLLKQKDADGFKGKPWRDWVLSKAAPKLMTTELEGVRAATAASLRKLWGMNMGENLCTYIRRKDMKSLRDIPEPESKSVLVVGGGPSVAIHQQLETLRDSGYKGSIVSCDRMLLPLLKMGIVPNYVISVDGSTIIRDFFKPKLVRDNLHKMTVIIHMASHPSVARLLYRYKARVHWFLAHQVYLSEEEVENSDVVALIYMTATEAHPKGIQTLVAGGNVGVAAWGFSWIILHKKKVALIGFDMGYPEGTPLNKTYYYSTFLAHTQETCGKNTFAAVAAEIPFEKEYNSVWKSWTYTDNVFRCYRQIFRSFLDIAPNDVQTFSCVEGGGLTHPRLKYATLKEWLASNPA